MILMWKLRGGRVLIDLFSRGKRISFRIAAGSRIKEVLVGLERNLQEPFYKVPFVNYRLG